MNIKLFLFSAIPYLLFYTNISVAQVSRAYMSKSALLTDVNYMLGAFEDIQVNCYLNISKKRLNEKKDSLFMTLPNEVPVNKAFILINQIAAFLKDTHTYVENDDYLFKEYKRSYLFPVKLGMDENKNIVIERKLASSGKLVSGQTIVSINGIPFNELFQQSINMQGGLLNYQISEALSYFSYNLFLLGVNAPFEVSTMNASAELVLDTLPGMSFSDYKIANQIKDSSRYRFAILQDNIGYIDFRSMSGGLKNFKIFLDSCFSTLKIANAKGLIVDLRYNGGGDSEYGELLLSYLTDKSYRLSSGRRFKVSQQYQEFMNKNYSDQSSIEVKTYLKAKPGTIISTKHKRNRYFAGNPNSFPLKTCFLIGPQNLSSATMLADGAKTYKLAKLIGEPTGAPANDGGESFVFTLPYSKFKISTSSAYDIRANGHKKDFNPVLPDILIKECISDNDDAILRAGIGWINNY